MLARTHLFYAADIDSSRVASTGSDKTDNVNVVDLVAVSFSIMSKIGAPDRATDVLQYETIGQTQGLHFLVV